MDDLHDAISALKEKAYYLRDDVDDIKSEVAELSRKLDILGAYMAASMVQRFITIPHEVAFRNGLFEGPYRSVVASANGATVTCKTIQAGDIMMDIFDVLEANTK